MTIPEHQICIHDASEIKYPFRNKEQKYQKPFIFKGYKTEEDRIKDTLKQNSFLYNIIEDSNKKKNKEKKSLSDNEDKYNFDIPNPIFQRKRMSIIEEEKLKDLAKHNILIQPQMRFKARTDLERVYDALRGKVFRNNEKNIIERQLKNINLNIFHKPQDILKKKTLNLSEDLTDSKEDNKEEKRTYKIKPNPIIEEFKKKEKEKNVNHLIYGNGNLFYDPRKDIYTKPWKRNMDLNSEAEGILSEYHIKTHFKACAEVAEKKINYKNLKLSRNNLHKRTYTLDNNDLNKKNRILIFEEPENEIDYDDYEKNENPFLLKKNESVDPQSLKALSTIAFGKDSIIRGDTAVVEQYIPTGKKNKYYHKRNLVDENSVLIDGKILYKDSQFDIIANKVLNICNIYKKKNLNNNSNLKKGSGKLMITKGLSVEQFRRKYKLND